MEKCYLRQRDIKNLMIPQSPYSNLMERPRSISCKFNFQCLRVFHEELTNCKTYIKILLKPYDYLNLRPEIPLKRIACVCNFITTIYFSGENMIICSIFFILLKIHVIKSLDETFFISVQVIITGAQNNTINKPLG